MRSYSSVYIVLILWIAGLCAAAQFAKMGLALPELQQLYPEAGVASGFIITLISLVGALLGLIAGILVGKIGARRVLLVGLVVGGIISVIQSFSLPLSFMLASRVVEGVSHLAIVVAAPTLIALHSSDRMRASAMTLWGTFFGVSFVLTAWLGLPIVAAYGIHLLFAAHALVIALTTILVVLFIPQSMPVSNKDRQSLRPYSVASLYKRHKQAWSSPTVAAPAAGWLFYTITYVALLAILPSLLPVDQRAYAAAAMPMASIISSMTLGVALLWRYRAIQVVNIGFISAIVTALLLLILPGSASAYIVLFIALGLIQGASFASIPQLNASASQQALAYGTLAQAGNIGNLCGTPLLLFLFHYGGSNAMVIVVMVCYTAAVLVHLRFSRQRAR